MSKYEIILTDSLEKPFGENAMRPLAGAISAWPGEIISFQVFARMAEGSHYLRPTLTLNITGPDADRVQLRRVLSMPVRLATFLGADDNYITKTPAVLPDPLVPADNRKFRLLSTQWDGFWCDIQLTDADAAKTLQVQVQVLDGENVAFTQDVTVQVQAQALPEQTLYHTQWFHADCLADYYHVDVWSEEHWRIVENYIASAASLGINMLLTPLFTPPLDTMVGAKRPTTQLVQVRRRDGSYSFDFSRLDRWIALCQKHGITELEMCHLFTQWGAAAAPQIVADTEEGEVQIFGWDTPAVGNGGAGSQQTFLPDEQQFINLDTPVAGGEYTRFLRIFLPELKAYLKEKDLLEHSWFHISDEPSEQIQAQWDAARRSIADLLEDCKLIDALSDFSFYQKGLIRTPVVANNHIEPFAQAQVPGLWTYYCCSQVLDVPNRLIAMPSARIRIMGVLLYRYDLAGFLQWGFNFYNYEFSQRTIDPWQTADGFGSWPAGDPFVVYPAPDGTAWDSIRGVVFREGLQDLRLLRLAESKLGRPAVLKLLEDSWDGGTMTMTHYPTDPNWFAGLRNKLAEVL